MYAVAFLDLLAVCLSTKLSVCVSDLFIYRWSNPLRYQRGARDRKPVRIAVDFFVSIGSLVDPRHCSDESSTHAVVGTECKACLSARCAAPTRAALPSGTTRLIYARASPPLILEQKVAKLSVDEHHLCILIQAMPVRHAAVKNQLQDVRCMLRAAGRAGGGLRSLSATRP